MLLVWGGCLLLVPGGSSFGLGVCLLLVEGVCSWSAEVSAFGPEGCLLLVTGGCLLLVPGGGWCIPICNGADPPLCKDTQV